MNRLHYRRRLPALIAAAWLVASWYVLLGAPTTPEDALESWVTLRPRWSDVDLVAWLGLMFVAMYVADRAYLAMARRLWGVDPYSVPWWRLRTEDGRPICPRCRGTMFVPPESLAEDEPVTCERCTRPLTSLADYRRRQPIPRFLR